jgi:cytochrome c biogenesis protein CcmG/thiol:disulfide interchange protein DsbE
MKPQYKLTVIACVMIATFLIAKYERAKFEDLFNHQVEDNILQVLPEFEIDNVFTDEKLNEKKYLNTEPRLLVVHFWGTWCGPCKVEFPELAKFTHKLSQRNVDFLFIAVNDELKKVKKELKTLSQFSKNSTHGFDKNGKTLDLFGTVKVPETYIFDQNGRALRKLVGPQDWSNPFYFNMITSYLK